MLLLIMGLLIQCSSILSMEKEIIEKVVEISRVNTPETVDTDAARYILGLLKMPLNSNLTEVRTKIDIPIIETGEALIHTLVKSEKLSILRDALKDLKADVNVVTKLGWTALHYAILYCPDAIPILMEFHSKIVPDVALRTPLHYAVIKNNIDALKLLLQHQPNLEVRSYEGTPLYIASELGFASAVELLLAAGACDEKIARPIALPSFNASIIDLDVCNYDGKGQQDSFTPLEIAIKKGHIEVIKAFARHKEKNGLREQFYAAAFDPSFIQPFHECGFTVQSLDKKKRTPLHYACPAAVSILLNLRANPETLDGDGCAAIHLAAESDENVLAVYIKLGKCLNLPDDIGCTPIFHAILKNHRNNFSALYKICNIQARTILGETLLHYAIKNQNIDVAKFLIKQNLFVNEKTYDKQTSLHYAARYCPSLIDVLLEAKVDSLAEDSQGYKIIHLAAAENAAALPYIIAHCPIDIRDGNQRTALMIADHVFNIESIKFLIKQKAEINGLTIPGTRKRTRIQFIAQYAPNQMKQELERLTDKMVLTEIDTQGWTVAHYATVFNPELLDGLKSAGADLCKPDSSGSTPFALAYLFYNSQAIRTLVILGVPPLLPKAMISTPPRHRLNLERQKKPNEVVRSNPLGDYEDDRARLKKRNEDVQKKITISTRSYASQSFKKE
jgi:ankyrin repeat protein